MKLLRRVLEPPLRSRPGERRSSLEVLRRELVAAVVLGVISSRAVQLPPLVRRSIRRYRIVGHVDSEGVR